MEETSHRRPRLRYIGLISVIILILVGPSTIMGISLFLRSPEVIYSSPEGSITIHSGEWYARSFTIDNGHIDWGVGAEGVLLSHNKNVDNIQLEFGYAPLSLTSFMSLNDTEKMDSFWGYGGSGWGLTGTEYATGHHGVGPVGEYVWAIRFTDLDDNSTVFETYFDISLTPM